jgi:uncharacterized protein with PQ loop repeat
LNEIGELFGFIAGSIGVATAIPQVIRIRKLGHAEGLELSPWVLMVIQFAAWTSFGLKLDSPSIYISNFLTFFTTALVVVAIVGNNLKSWALIVLGGLAVGVFVFLGPSEIVDWALIILTGARLPQLIRTWINRASAKATAVSISSLLIALTSMGFWMAYAVFTENGLVIVTTTTAISITLMTAILEGWIARRGKLNPSLRK